MSKKEKLEILQEIEQLEQDCGSIIDAIITVCEKYSIDIDTISQYLKYSKEMKERIKSEGFSLRLLNE